MTALMWTCQLAHRCVSAFEQDSSVAVWDTHTGALLHTLRPDRPYERMDIRGLTGVTEAQRAALIALGAVERSN